MKLLITGGEGQLGKEAALYFSKKHEVIALGRKDLDITDERIVVEEVSKIKPDMIINAAAYTDVDGCEDNRERAFSINGYGACNLAKAAESIGAGIVHISTDFVFDGSSRIPYIESDRTNPLSVYGKSKLLGEELVSKNCSKHYIVRTAWLYGAEGKNFVKTMLRLSKEKDYLSVVDDQVGCPTSVRELIRIVDTLINSDAYGIYNGVCSGSCSWYEFALKIFELAGVNIRVERISSEKLGRKAPRPAYSVLNTSKLKLNFGYEPTDWVSALKLMMPDIINSIDCI